MSSIYNFVVELQDLCNKYELELKADREENIGIYPQDKPMVLGTQTYTWGKTIYVDIVKMDDADE